MKKLIIGLLIIGLLTGCTKAECTEKEGIAIYMEENHPNADIVGIDGFGYDVRFVEDGEVRSFIFGRRGKVVERDGFWGEITVGNWSCLLDAGGRE